MNPFGVLFYYYKSFSIISSRAMVSQVLKTTVIALCNCLSVVNPIFSTLDPLYHPLPRSDVVQFITLNHLVEPSQRHSACYKTNGDCLQPGQRS